VDLTSSDGLAMVVKEVLAELKEVDKSSSDEEKLNSEDIPMATSEPEVDESFDDETAHLILAEDTGTASEGEVMSLLGDLLKTPSFIYGKKGKEREDQVDSEVQYDQDISQHDDTFTRGDGESHFKGFNEDEPHAGMGVHSVTPELSHSCHYLSKHLFAPVSWSFQCSCWPFDHSGPISKCFQRESINFEKSRR
jgi:hypothetical protein